MAAQARGDPLAGAAAALVVAIVVPLALLQLPNLPASGMSAAAIARIAGPNGGAGLVRAAGLALPVMACVAPVAAVVARRDRAWPSLVAGLVLLGAADLLGASARSLLLIAVDRGLHGLGAGITLPATLALAWERTPRWRRVLGRWWTVVLVISLLGSVPLLRDRLTGGDWRAALYPFPWLNSVASAAAHPLAASVPALTSALTRGASSWELAAAAAAAAAAAVALFIGRARRSKGDVPVRG